MSLRKAEPMVSVDPGSLSESLFESELFGYVKGAFTDAKTDRAGKFEAADKGTLFLDEIGNLKYTLQAKLLTALQSRMITRVGSTVAIPVDIRLICATNKDLNQLVRNGQFREDLLYRINTIQIEVPPLRSRKEDIGALTRFFLDKFAKKYNKPDIRLSDKTAAKLENYSWPGNVRELQHAIEKAVILSEGDSLEPADFYFNSAQDVTDVIDSVSLDDMERILVQKALDNNNGNISAAAAQLGITRPTMYNKMKKYVLK